MEFKYDPIPFIFKKGDAFTKLCVLEMVGLRDTPRGKELILDLLKSQQKDGGFPSKIDSNYSGVKESERTANLLLKCQLPKDGLALTSCIRFLLRNQTEDGGFRENSKLSIPPRGCGALYGEKHNLADRRYGGFVKTDRTGEYQSLSEGYQLAEKDGDAGRRMGNVRGR
jgi:hypothetical protein